MAKLKDLWNEDAYLIEKHEAGETRIHTSRAKTQTPRSGLKGEQREYACLVPLVTNVC
jgi:hypothetical protein